MMLKTCLEMAKDGYAPFMGLVRNPMQSISVRICAYFCIGSLFFICIRIQ